MIHFVEEESQVELKDDNEEIVFTPNATIPVVLLPSAPSDIKNFLVRLYQWFLLLFSCFLLCSLTFCRRRVSKMSRNQSETFGWMGTACIDALRTQFMVTKTHIQKVTVHFSYISQLNLANYSTVKSDYAFWFENYLQKCQEESLVPLLDVCLLKYFAAISLHNS